VNEGSTQAGGRELARTHVLTTIAALALLGAPSAGVIACTPGKTAAPTRPVAEVHTSIEKCQNTECRLLAYLELFRGGADLLSGIRDASAPCGKFAATGCPSVPWCLSLLQGTYHLNFQEESDVVWLGRDAASVKEITDAAERTLTEDGLRTTDQLNRNAAHLAVASVTLSRDAQRWREVPSIGLAVPRRVHDVVPIENCTVVFADACAGRIGYVCTGSPWWNAVGSDGWIPVELDLESPPTHRALSQGRLVSLD
jgi:hypothetical protein